MLRLFVSTSLETYRFWFDLQVYISHNTHIIANTNSLQSISKMTPTHSVPNMAGCKALSPSLSSKKERNMPPRMIQMSPLWQSTMFFTTPSSMLSNMSSLTRSLLLSISHLSINIGRQLMIVGFKSIPNHIHHHRWLKLTRRLDVCQGRLMIITSVWSSHSCSGQMQLILPTFVMHPYGWCMFILVISQNIFGVSPLQRHVIILHIFHQ